MMKTILRQTGVIFFCFVSVPLYASATLFVDCATFQPSQEPYTEISYSIPVSHVQFTEVDTLFKAELYVKLELFIDEQVYMQDEWRMTHSLTDTLNKKQSMIDLVRYRIEPGEYHLVLTVMDIKGEQEFKNEKNIIVPQFSKAKLEMSDLVLAHSISRSKDTENTFVKQGFKVVPNPGQFYGEGFPILYYYLELYNLKILGSKEYQLCLEISDEQQHPLANQSPRIITKPVVESSIEVGTIDVSSLPSGIYHLSYKITSDNETKIENHKKFYIFNSVIPAFSQSSGIVASFENSEYAIMTESMLDERFEKLSYILNDNEKEVFSQLKDPKAKAHFLFSFWQRNDPTPGTLFNEFRIEYTKRLEYAENHFKSYTRSGWQTDRGRVYILFGPPSDVDYNHNNAFSYAYELWRYEGLEGGVDFVFADFQEFGEYVQIHSTKQGESRNENWKKLVEK